MGIVKDYLDPNAQSYDDLADLDEAAAAVLVAAASKLAGIEEGAEANPTATEIRDAIVGLSDDNRKIVISRPTTGQYKVYALQRHSDGKTEIERSDTATP